MAHRLAKALERPSAYSVKKTDWWDDTLDRIAGCLLDVQLDEVEDWLKTQVMQFPGAWEEDLAEIIEKKREEIAAENISFIIWDRYDFT